MKFDCQFVVNKDGLVAVIIKNKSNNNEKVIIESGFQEIEVDMKDTLEYHSVFLQTPIRVREIRQ